MRSSSVTSFKTLDIYFQIALRKVVPAFRSHQYCIVVILLFLCSWSFFCVLINSSGSLKTHLVYSQGLFSIRIKD